MADDTTADAAQPPWDEVMTDVVLRRWMLGRSRPEKLQASTLLLNMGIKFRFRGAVGQRRRRGKFSLGKVGRTKVAALRVAPGTLQLEAALALAGRSPITNVLAFGQASGLDPALAVGDLVVASAAVPGEGLTLYYEGATPCEPDAQLLGVCREKATGPLEAAEGRVYTTASLARLDDEFVEARRAEGEIGIDTSTAALYRVARHYGLAAVAVLIVSDNPTTGEICLSSRNLMTRFERGIQRAFALVAETAQATAPAESEPRRRRLGLRGQRRGSR